jgi:hypothetical protein
MSVQALQKAVLEQIRSSRQVQQQITKQLEAALTTGKASGKITVRIPVSPEDVSVPVFRTNDNRGRRRFVLNGTQQRSKRGKLE